MGIDPGLLNLGYAIIESRGNQLDILDANTLKTRSEDPLPKRLYQLYLDLTSIIRAFSPDALIVEEPLSGVNPHSTAKVIQVYATILLASMEAPVNVYTFKPTEWKKALFGYGQISKSALVRSLEALLNQSLDEAIKKDEHLLDALSLAYLGLLSVGVKHKSVNRRS